MEKYIKLIENIKIAKEELQTERANIGLESFLKKRRNTKKEIKKIKNTKEKLTSDQLALITKLESVIISIDKELKFMEKIELNLVKAIDKIDDEISSINLFIIKVDFFIKDYEKKIINLNNYIEINKDSTKQEALIADLYNKKSALINEISELRKHNKPVLALRYELKKIKQNINFENHKLNDSADNNIEKYNNLISNFNLKLEKEVNKISDLREKDWSRRRINKI